MTFTGEGTGDYDNADFQFTGDLLRAIFQNGPDKIPQTMSNIAVGMTNNMRLKSGGTTAPGIAIII